MLATRSIDAQKYKQQYRKTPQRRASITKEWQGYTNDRTQPNNHTYVDKQMEEEYSQYAIGIDPAKRTRLSLGYGHDT